MHWRGLIVDTLEGIFILQKLRICMYFRRGGEGSSSNCTKFTKICPFSYHIHILPSQKMPFFNEL